MQLWTHFNVGFMAECDARKAVIRERGVLNVRRENEERRLTKQRASSIGKQLGFAKMSTDAS